MIRLALLTLGFIGTTAALLWSLMAFTVGMVVLPGPAILSALAQLLLVDALLGFAQRREAGAAWSLGLRLGLVSWLGGPGLLWMVACLAWLPLMSHRFRGWAGVRLAAVVVVVWAVSLSPMLVRSLVVQGDAELPFVPAAGAIITASDSGQLWPAPAAADSVDADPTAGASNSVHDAARALTVGGGRTWASAARRAIAFVGGWSPFLPTTAVPLLRWDLLVVLSWLGTVALVPSRRAFLPLYLGLGLPLLQGAFTGLGPGPLGAAAPFVALFAGYGLQRWWRGKTWLATWLVAPAVLLLAILARSWVHGWH